MQFQYEGRHPQDPGERMVQTNAKGSLPEFDFCQGRLGLFVLFRPSTDWMRPPPDYGGRSVYLKLANFNCNLIPKLPPI